MMRVIRAARARFGHERERASTLPHSSTTVSTRHSRHSRRSTGAAETLDTTIKNAIESLTQDDAESALVFALVHDSEFRLATAIASNPAGADVNVIRALLFVFDTYEDQLRKFIGLLMFQEMVDTLNWNELFRANSATTAIIREYTCDLGMEFLQQALQDIIVEMWETTDSYEINPKHLQEGEDIEVNRERLEALADRILDRICNSAHLYPYQIAKIYRVLELEMMRLLERDRKSNISIPRLSAIGEEQQQQGEDRRSNTSLPRISSIGEDGSDDLSLSSNSAAREEFQMHLGGLVFLRFICPALVLPHKMHLTPNDEAPSKNLQRNLVLVAKLFQSLANNVEYGAREDYMLPFNPFLARNRSKLNRFYEQICQQSQNDNRRESMIARSHITPRISQVWTTINGKDSVVNLTGGVTVESSEENLPILRRWICENIEFITKEVAGDGKLRRRKKGIIVNSGLKKKKPKRKLKSVKSRSPFQHPDIDVVKEVDEESERIASRSRGASAPVSPEELDEMIGHTSHRDIQLMKLYYSKLSQKGLQLLFEANDSQSNHEWVTYKSKDHVDVLRRDSSRFVCPSTGFRSDKDRFVEMKASVVVKSTPRKLFQYLRSLDSMSEWDEYAGSIKKVEPLDDSRVIMYRSHPKLSLWPSWLVKPRDTCDLHSFVEKTGRYDTFAVLMESIPRPDVPEIKGTVRMSYATGGFLIEPSFGEDVEVSQGADPAQGAFAKLTCVVRADFKGILPRYLAESICYRQVLSILSIRSRVEASRAQTDSNWV
uniref:Ras-GAP domain-containing protein n=1 Tax=Globisporangium ultimum (strain ATCC 200006 / CBS 805.95 / DAOM BR144) TaxID=431595 RepID=K3WCC3_GLOUD